MKFIPEPVLQAAQKIADQLSEPHRVGALQALYTSWRSAGVCVVHRDPNGIEYSAKWTEIEPGVVGKQKWRGAVLVVVESAQSETEPL